MKQLFVVLMGLLMLGGSQKGFSQNKVAITCITGFQGGGDLLIICKKKIGKDNADFFIKLDNVTIKRITSEAKSIREAMLWSITDNILFFEPTKDIRLDAFAMQIQAILNACAPQYDFTVQLPSRKG